MTLTLRVLPVLALTVSCTPPTPSDPADPREGATEPTEPTEPLRQTTEPTVDPGDPALLGDCAPNDPAIGPEVADVDGDGIDSDCDGQDGPSARPAIVLRGPDGEWNLGQGLVARVDLSGDGVADIMGCSSERCTIWGDGLHVVDEVTGIVGLSAVGGGEACVSVPSPAELYRPRLVCLSAAGSTTHEATTGADPTFVAAVHLTADGTTAFTHEVREPGVSGPMYTHVAWDRVADTRTVLWSSADDGSDERVLVGVQPVAGAESLVFRVGGAPAYTHHVCPLPFDGAIESCTALASGVGLGALCDVDADGVDERWVADAQGSFAVDDVLPPPDRATARATLASATGWAGGVPDLTGDGVDDVLVVARSTPTTPGRVHLVPGPVSGEVSLAGSPSWAGVALGGGFGASTDVGDVDGDGLLDLVIAAPDDGYGAIFVVPGTELQ